MSVGSWNLSGWSAGRLRAIAEDLDVGVLAVQETHLMPVKLERAHGAARRVGCRLVHGRAVPPMETRRTQGQHLGVGFVVRQAVVTQPVLPTGAAERMLHATGRLCMLRLPPSLAMPQGLLLASFYAPQAKSEEAPRFRAAVIEVLTALDAAVPTLLLGDWNGTTTPSRDYLSGSGPSCPLLGWILGPGTPWRDALVAVSPGAFNWTFWRCSVQGGCGLAVRPHHRQHRRFGHDCLG